MANTYELITSNTVGSGGVSSVTFSSIPGTYTDLVIKLSVRDGRPTLAVSDIRFNFNGTGVGTNISGRYVYGNGSSAASTTVGSNGELAFADGNGATVSTFGNAEVYIPNYAGSAYKGISSDSAAENNATAGYNLLLAGLFGSTSAITSIAMTPFSGNFAEYSTFYLYGIKNS
jgi:hypothetical protein